MSQTEIESVKKKIVALSNKTTAMGCTEEEAMSAAEKIGELLLVYNLSANDIFLSGERCIKKAFTTGQKQDHPVSGTLSAIATLCDCKIWREWNGSYQFFGLEHDVEYAIYLSQVVYGSMVLALIEYKNTAAYRNSSIHGKRKNASFLKGMARRISDRIKDIKEKMVEEYKEEIARIECKSIIPVKSAKVDKEFDLLNLNLRTVTKKSTISDWGSYSSGKKAGDNVNLSRPVAGSSGSTKMLT